ncbi:MAG TPA: hypothetical protein VFS21_24035, partial [Roseiflexaceae bacterium]|nr:hypothetical protein [Roseiflexaceae bacterium]
VEYSFLPSALVMIVSVIGLLLYKGAKRLDPGGRGASFCAQLLCVFCRGGLGAAATSIVAVL